jgi:hypothetical protein
MYSNDLRPNVAPRRRDHLDAPWRAPASIATVLLLSGLTLACGARSTLEAGAGASSGAGAQGGGGGATTTSQGGAGQGGAGPGGAGPGGAGPGGAGGQGGAFPAVCPVLMALEPMAMPKPSPGFALHDPLLFPLAAGSALLVARANQLESPGPVPSQVDTLPFAPWGVWPPAFALPKLAHPVANPVPFAAGMEPGGTLALLVQPFPTNAPPGCPIDALFGVLPDAPQWPMGFMFPVQGGCVDTPLAVGSNGEGLHFAAADISSNVAGQGLRGLSFQVFDGEGQLLIPPQIRCASTPHTGDVLGGQHEFLFAHSAAINDACGDPNAPAGPSTQLVLRRLSKDAASATTLFQATDELVLTRLLPRSSGAWLIFQESGKSALIQPPALAMRLSADGAPGAPFPITDPGLGQVAVAPFGDGFAVAVVDAIDPSAPTIRLAVFSAEGLVEAQTSFSTGGAWLMNERLALLGAPDGKALLVGWVGTSPDLGASIFLRRFDCTDLG